MPPDDSRRTSFTSRQRSYMRPTTLGAAPQTEREKAAQEATVGIVRGQIEHIFEQNARSAQASQPVATKETAEPTPQPAAVQTNDDRTAKERAEHAEDFAETSHTSPDSPYDRTHESNRTQIHDMQWKRYHSAWQDYYRQYYERYYIGEVYRMRETLDAHTNPTAPTQTTAHADSSEELSESDEAFHRLRADLLNNVRTQTVKVRNSRHFMPILAAALTMLIFVFLQYNRVLFANVEAYVSPGNINPANIIVDPNINIPVGDEPRLIIPKINVDVPVVYDTKNDQASQLSAMEKGVAWFGIPGANSKPGQVGNTVLSGHSSNDLFDPGDYKFIFARLDQLIEGDTFYVNYLGTRYTYSITKKEVVKPTDVHKLVYETDKPVMTLITCVPLGTAQNRLLVTAEQVSPNPSQAKAAPESEGTSDEAAMPGNTPSIFSRLFGG